MFFLLFFFVVFHSLKEQSFCFQKGLMIWVPLYLVTYLETSFKSLYFLKKLNFFKVLNIRSLRMLHLDQCMWRPLCKKKNECTVELACFYRYFFFISPAEADPDTTWLHVKRCPWTRRYGWEDWTAEVCYSMCFWMTRRSNSPGQSLSMFFRTAEFSLQWIQMILTFLGMDGRINLH